MLSFDAPLFAFAGLLAAAGPIIVHLLNRRRFRVVAWGAIEFLREALERQRRAVQLRDLLLLIVRVLAVVLFGLALARPYLRGALGTGMVSSGLFLVLCLSAALAAAAWTVFPDRRTRSVSGTLAVLAFGGALGLWGWSTWASGSGGLVHNVARAPVHAVLVIDNSRSMGVETTGGSRLDLAKQRARQFLDELPPESRVTLLAAAGTDRSLPTDAFSSKSDALRALDELSVVDAADDITAALEQAELACGRLSDPETKRVVVLSDLQSPRWTEIDWSSWSQRLAGLQIASVDDTIPGNFWIDSLELEDGLAGAEAPARFLARLRAEEITEPISVDVNLRIDGVTVGSQVVELAAGQTRELEFPHRFDVGGEPGRPRWATATLELRPEAVAVDRLSADNVTSIVAPVVDAIPVVFVDQYGDREDPSRGRIGETYALRHLLAPRIASDEAPRRLIHIQHVDPELVTPELLETARLVVVGGIESPEGLVATLKDYVLQGGPLVLLAGGEFDPQQWHLFGWNHGDGILPLPLAPQPIGVLPSATAELQPFFGDFASMQHRDFRIEGEDPQSLAALFESVPFFRAVAADATDETLDELVASRTAAWEARLQTNAPSNTSTSPAGRQFTSANWWAWRTAAAPLSATMTARELAERERPEVLASYTADGLPWVIQRRMGAGTVLFFTSGVASDWNLLRTSSAMYVFHRALFRLIADTLPRRNVVVGERLVLPQPAGGDQRYELERPGGLREPLAVEALESNATGVVVRRTLASGVYRIDSISTTGNEPDSSAVATWAAMAPDSESLLGGVSVSELRAAVGDAPVRVLDVGEAIRLEGGSRQGERLWKWAVAAVLIGLLAEMALLGAPEWRRAAA